jgi:hypothetical protein
MGMHTDLTLGISTGLAAVALSVLVTIYAWIGALFVDLIANRLTAAVGQLSPHGF